MRLLDTLRSSNAVKYHLLIQVYICYFLVPLRRCFCRLYVRLRDEARDEKIRNRPFWKGAPHEQPIQIRYVEESEKELGLSLGFHEEFKAYKLYKIFSTIYMIYVIIRWALLGNILAQLELDLPVQCYLPGRLLIYGPLIKNLSELLCLFHIGWRLLQWCFDPGCRLDFVAVMFKLKEAIEHESCKSTSDKNHGGLDRYLRTIMYYPVLIRREIQYRLRPNRAPEALQIIATRAASSSCIGYFIMFLFTIVFAPLVTYSILSDIIHVQAYSGCEPQLDEMIRNNQLPFWSVTLTWRRIITIIFDFSENIIIWCDSGLVITLVGSLIYSINYDLLFYWGRLKHFLDQILHNKRGRYYANRTCNIKPSHDPSTKIRRGNYCDSHEAQAMIADYFVQAENADLYISNVVTLCIISWFSIFIVIGHRSHKVLTQEVTVNLRIIQTTLFVVMLAAAKCLFSLYYRNLKLYHTICSLMAHDSTIFKLKYIGILSFFTGRRFTYTLFHSYPITPIAGLTLLGYTFSCAIIMDNMFGHENSTLRR